MLSFKGKIEDFLVKTIVVLDEPGAGFDCGFFKEGINIMLNNLCYGFAPGLFYFGMMLGFLGCCGCCSMNALFVLFHNNKKKSDGYAKI